MSTIACSRGEHWLMAGLERLLWPVKARPGDNWLARHGWSTDGVGLLFDFDSCSPCINCAVAELVYPSGGNRYKL